MIGFLHPEPSPPPPVANCVTSTQWCVTSTSGLIIAPVNAATLLPLLLDSIESPPSTDCPTSALARNHQIVCPSDRCHRGIASLTQAVILQKYFNRQPLEWRRSQKHITLVTHPDVRLACFLTSPGQDYTLPNISNQKYKFFGMAASQ